MTAANSSRKYAVCREQARIRGWNRADVESARLRVAKRETDARDGAKSVNRRGKRMHEPVVGVSAARSRVVAMAEARARLRPNEVRHEPDYDVIVNDADDRRAAEDEDMVIYSLSDAVLMMFHLLAERREPFACRDLRNAVRRAINAEPMIEVVEMRSSTWAAIRNIGFVPARLASRQRFDDTYRDLD